MVEEIYNLMQVWLLAIISLCYCYMIGKLTSKGITRLLCLIPVVSLFLYLPIKIQSVQIGATTSFFLAWLANFKLLLFAFGKGPLSSSSSHISLIHFIALACLPIKIQHNPNEKYHQTDGRNKKSPINYVIKGLLLAILVSLHDQCKSYMHPTIVLVMYGFYVYFFLEIALAVVSAVARALLGLDLEPQFDEPYLSTSLQDFWGRRWNLMVTSILRPTVYDPVLNFSSRLIGRKWAPLPAVLGTFIVSALMHELIFYHFGRMRPTWEISLFFLLHGVCLTAEIALKKALKGRSWQLPRPIAIVLTIGFVMVTGVSLFFPQIIRCRAIERALHEYAALDAFVKNGVGLLTTRSFN